MSSGNPFAGMDQLIASAPPTAPSPEELAAPSIAAPPAAGGGFPDAAPPARPKSQIKGLLLNFASNLAMNLGDYFVQRGGGENPRFGQNFYNNQLQRMNQESDDAYKQGQLQIGKREQDRKDEEVTIQDPHLGLVRIPKKDVAGYYKNIGTNKTKQEVEDTRQTGANTRAAENLKFLKDKLGTDWTKRYELEKFRQDRMDKRAKERHAMAASGDYDSAVGLWSDAIANGEAKLTEAPRNLRSAILAERAKTGALFVPAALRKDLDEFTGARSAMSKIESLTERYIESGDPRDGLMLRAEIKGFGTMIGRSVGNKGVFTDQDQERIETAINAVPVSSMLTPLAPDMARESLKNIESVMDAVEKRKFSTILGTYNREGAKTGSGPRKPGQPAAPAVDPFQGLRVK